MIYIIACIDRNNGIGLNGTMPWHFPPDLKFFREKTLNNVVVMGRRTFASIGQKPLHSRRNIVISSRQPKYTSVEQYALLSDALATIDNKTDVYIIGGNQLYKESIDIADIIYLTRLDIDASCDTFFPMDALDGFINSYSPWMKHGSIKYRFETYYKHAFDI